MGTRMAPSYTNLFMGKLEQRLLVTQIHKSLWWRYMDDIFTTWTYGKQSLEAFISNLDKEHKRSQPRDKRNKWYF